MKVMFKSHYDTQFPQVYLVKNGSGNELRNKQCQKPLEENDLLVVQSRPGRRIVVKTPHKQCSTHDVIRALNSVIQDFSSYTTRVILAEMEDGDGDRIDVSEFYYAVEEQVYEDNLVTFHHMLLPHTERIFESYCHFVVTDEDGDEHRQEMVTPESIVKKILCDG